VRDEEGLARAIEELSVLGTRAARVGVTGNREYNPGWHTALDLANLLMVSEAVARSALDRRESRGGHFRDDYPEKDEAFAEHNTVIRLAGGGGMLIEREARRPIPDDLQEIIREIG